MPALPLGKDPLYLLTGGWVGRSPVWMFWKRERYVALVGIQTLNYPVCSLVTTYAILSPVQRTAVLNITLILNALIDFNTVVIIFRHVSKIVIDAVPEDYAVLLKCVVCIH
jgi:hypothetical protein